MNVTQELAMSLLEQRLEYARNEHPLFARDVGDAIRVIEDEFDELTRAHLGEEGPGRIIDEALDVAATAMRLVMGEVQG